MSIETLDHTLHAPSMEGAANGVTDVQRARHMATFLTLRVVDLFAESASADAISYQIDATAKRIADTLPEEDGASELAVLDASRRANALGDSRLIWGALEAYSRELEGELRLAEAIDILDTALRLRGVHEGRTRALWRRGRVLRLAGRLDDSLDSYADAHRLALELGDEEIQLRSRSGASQTLVRKGNIPEAERILHEVLADCRRMGHRRIEASSHHDLAMVQDARGLHAAAALSLYRSYELHEDDWAKMRVISDLGMNLKNLGEYGAAKDCFEIFLAADPNPGARLNANLEVLELAARRSDRAGFDRLYADLSQMAMPPDACVDFHLKAGQGFALFGERSRARDHLETALRHAEEHHLNTYLFKVETELESLARPAPAPRTVVSDEFRSEVRFVADNLREIRATV